MAHKIGLDNTAIMANDEQYSVRLCLALRPPCVTYQSRLRAVWGCVGGVGIPDPHRNGGLFACNALRRPRGVRPIVRVPSGKYDGTDHEKAAVQGGDGQKV
ncbi:hypothetical protein NHX12_005114 [Muraenolepis orangiensis]|uniref:Uncharacterized protein n=1 Tax=Muraenolepis orangiensis TaxID=630683 RepID=A0A9Q0DTC2_9TELE|nr:hypothetical protein NHX12_005114 [Muraenolepis orangiensis]